MYLMIPYWFVVISIPALLVIPVYYFNQFLISRIRPRDNGKRLLAFFIITIGAVFIYISAIVYLIMGVARCLK